MLKKPIFWIALIIVMIIGLLVLVLQFNSPKNLSPKLSEKPKSEVAAVVNGEKISMKGYETLFKAEKAALARTYEAAPSSPPEVLSQTVVGVLIQDVLLTQYLREKGVVITEKEVREYAQKEVVDPMYGGNWQNYEEFIKKNNSRLDFALQNLRRQLLTEKVAGLENIKDPGTFDIWYFNLKSKAKISISPDLAGTANPSSAP